MCIPIRLTPYYIHIHQHCLRKSKVMQTRCHLSVLALKQAEKYGEREAFTYKDFGGSVWKTMSYSRFATLVKEASNALLNLGAKPQDAIGVFSQNCIQYLITDFGAYGVRVMSVPFYATSSEQQIQYMINDAQIRFLFVGEQEQYDKAHRIFPLCHSLERIIVFDRSVRISSHDPAALYFDDFLKLGQGLPRQTEVEALYKQANNEDICNILYTSGTTGESKGVVLTYGQYDAALTANDEAVPIRDKDRTIQFLPVTHIFERGWSYLCFSEGSHIIINTDPHEIQQSMRETHPTSMSSVPRFWEKVYQAVKDKIDRSSSMQQKLFRHALEVGRRYNVDCKSQCRRPSPILAMEYKLMDKLVLRLVRKQIGLENSHIFPTAGATVSPEVERFVHSVGINMVVGYGLTESLATVSCDRDNMPYTIGSVGRPIKGIEVKIGDNDEILLKGPTITRGYYKRDAANAAAFTEDGFFRTGDAGYMKNGELFLTDRIKDLFKTSNGKYIAPQMIESLVLVDKFVDQIAIIANERKFVSALIVPEFRLLEDWAKDNGVEVESREQLCQNPKIIKMMTERIHTLQQQLAPYEQIKRFTLIAHHFSMESGELTNTLKIRRAVIYKNFKEVIDKMYEC